MHLERFWVGLYLYTQCVCACVCVGGLCACACTCVGGGERERVCVCVRLCVRVCVLLTSKYYGSYGPLHFLYTSLPNNYGLFCKSYSLRSFLF